MDGKGSLIVLFQTLIKGLEAVYWSFKNCPGIAKAKEFTVGKEYVAWWLANQPHLVVQTARSPAHTFDLNTMLKELGFKRLMHASVRRELDDAVESKRRRLQHEC